MLSLVPLTYFRWDSCWNFPVGASELITFVARSDRFCYSQSVKIPSQVFLLGFPRWGFTLIVRSQGTHFFSVGGSLFFSFLGELHHSSLRLKIISHSFGSPFTYFVFYHEFISVLFSLLFLMGPPLPFKSNLEPFLLPIISLLE